MDILFKNITAVTMNPAAPVLTNVDIGITGRHITHIAPHGQACAPAVL
ncbi:MAG: hypothetical protein FWC78_05400 [Defluviitaleaceae bacterium]|nr:hypothetical protein [Defluviitaleaceae bacterium]